MNSSDTAICPVCESTSTFDFFELKQVPVSDGFLPGTRDDAIGAPTGDIKLSFCRGCGHIANRLFDPQKLQFDDDYDISLFYSPAYSRFVEALVERLVRSYQLRGKVALEIACGKGDFLRSLVQGGMSRGIGFDPTFVPTHFTDAELRMIEVHKEYYTAAHGSMGADLVCCRSALQYFTRPREFAAMIRAALALPRSTVVYLEVPNAQEVFRDEAVWNVVYEHGCFYCASSLSTLMRQSGFDTVQVGPCFEGQNLGIDARPSKQRIGTGPELRAEVEALHDRVKTFADCYRQKVEFWKTRVAEYRAKGARVVLWGAGARAISFCSAIDVSGVIDRVVDINPKRQGRFLPRSGQEVIAPEALRVLKPDLVIATNPTFAPEIEAQLRQISPKTAFSVL